MARKKRNLPVRAVFLIILIVVIAWVYYYQTGSDPTGIVKFTKMQAESFRHILEELSSPDKSRPPETTVAASAGGGEWWQVYFTDPVHVNDPQNLTNSVAEKLIRHIEKARRSIHIASFEFNLTPIAEALIAAHQRGVEIKWVTDNEHGLEADEEKGHGQFAMLKKAGIEVKADTRSALMHNKFWIFDQKTVWTGSTNITVNGIFKNNNNVIVIQSTELADIYEQEFLEMWENKFGPRSPSTLNEQQIKIESTPVQVLFAPEDDVAEQLIPLIEKAQKSIRFMAFSFTHDGIGQAVLARAQAGVDVKGIFETRGSETKYSEMYNLQRAGVPVRQDGNPRTFHHKVIILDDQTVITGSFNFSKNANKNNDENLLILTNKNIAALYLQEFTRRWAEAEAPDAAPVL